MPSTMSVFLPSRRLHAARLVHREVLLVLKIAPTAFPVPMVTPAKPLLRVALLARKTETAMALKTVARPA